MMKISLTTVFISLFATSDVNAAAIQIPRTGQTLCYDAVGAVIACTGTGQDGDKLKGVAAPTPRFTDNANGTVSDNLTGLIWLKNANCFYTQIWTAALASANALASGTCGLTDGSTAGQWRLPDRKELSSLVDHSKSNPALPTGHLFASVQPFYYYWSSSSDAINNGYAWLIDMDKGVVTRGQKTYKGYVWPVRSGQ